MELSSPAPAARRRAFAFVFIAVAVAVAMLLGAGGATAKGGLSVKVVSVSHSVESGSQASAWFRVTAGSTCRLRARSPNGGAARSAASRIRQSLVQYDWRVSPRAASGSWKVTLACRRSLLTASASTFIRLRHGRKRHGGPLFARHLTPTQANLTTAGDGRGGGSWRPFGTVLVRGSSWLGGKGVDVISNGLVGCYAGCTVASGYGIAYQCVELVQRLIVTRHWSPRIFGNARDQYANASSAYFDKHPNGSGYTPVPGDIIVYRGGWEGYGHVSVVEWVSGGRIGWVEQNASASGRGSAPLGAGGRLGNQGSLVPIGYLHAKANRPAAPKAVQPSPPPDPAPASPQPSPSTPGDKSQPTVPGSLKITSPTTSSLTLSWSKSSDDTGVAGYSLYRGGTKLTTTAATSYKFTGLACGKSYSLGADAYDAAGNHSAIASVSGSTSACPRSVTVSKGSHVSVSGCSSSACAYVTVKLSNFSSGSHTVVCYSDYPPPTGSYYQYTTSSTTSNVCVYGYSGTHVWVTVDGVESNRLTW